jgi:thioredoxin 1
MHPTILYMMILQSLPTYRDLQDKIQNEPAVLFYFSFPSCGVCKSLKPKVAALVQENFPRLQMYYVDIETVPEAAGQLSVFTVPAVLVFFQGKELIREARNFGIQELGGKIDRYYSMLFGEGD